MCAEISDSSFAPYFVCIYLPPGHPIHFFEDFQDLFENCIILLIHTCLETQQLLSVTCIDNFVLSLKILLEKHASITYKYVSQIVLSSDDI